MIGRNSGRGRVARTCFLGPRLSLVHRGRAADLKNRSALRLLNSKDLRVEVSGEHSEESRSAAQGKLREGSRSECFQGSAGFFLGRRGDLLRMTVPTVSSAACLGPPKSGLIVSRIARGRGLGGQLFHIVQNAAIPWLKPGPAHARVSDRMDFESTHSLTRGGK